MATVHFRLSTKVTNGRAEVLMRFVGGRDIAMRAKTHVFCPVNAWSDSLEQVVVPKKISPETQSLRDIDIALQKLRHTIFMEWERAQYDYTPDWLQCVADQCAGINKTSNDTRQTLADTVRLYAKTKELADTTREQYEVIASSIDRYCSTHRVIYTDKLCGADLDSFEEFLSCETVSGKTIKRGGNTVVTRMKKLRAVCNWAVDEEILKESPFGIGKGKYKVGTELYGDPTFLTIEERDALYLFDNLPPYLAAQRDIFVFQCHVGCRVSDLVSLTDENVTPDGFLQYIPIKTRNKKVQSVRVPLSGTAMEIICRYKGAKPGRLLPFAPPEKYDAYIHDILERAGMNRTVIVMNPQTRQEEFRKIYEIGSSHLARRTFIQHVFEHTESEIITSSFTGHSPNSRAFRRYARSTDKMKQTILDRVNAISK